MSVALEFLKSFVATSTLNFTKPQSLKRSNYKLPCVGLRCFTAFFMNSSHDFVYARSAILGFNGFIFLWSCEFQSHGNAHLLCLGSPGDPTVLSSGEPAGA